MAKKQMNDRSTDIHELKGLIKKFDTGWINRSDWTNVHLGSVELDYDNLSGEFIVGETVTETGGSGATGVIISDDGATLKLRNVGNGGIFANNNVITGNISGATADVNEPSGDNKNQDTNLCHNFNDNLSRCITKVFYSTDGTEANSGELNLSDSNLGWQVNQIDVNNFIIQTGSSGCTYLSTAGSSTTIAAQDWYYRIIVYRIAL